MSFSVGIVGLPNAGKSTLFKALTKNKVDIAPYPFTTIQPNVGIVAVPDERLEKISQIIKPQRIVPTVIEFVDIAGLIKGAHKGEGLGNQFLARIRDCDAILEIVRIFENPDVEHIEGSINPERDIETIKVELLMKDLEILENVIIKLEKDTKRNDKNLIKKVELLRKIKEAISQGKSIAELKLSEEEQMSIQEYQFLTSKPIVYILNSNDGKNLALDDLVLISLNLKLESEITDLSKIETEELGIRSELDKVILKCYDILNLVTFYTVAGGEETRAWTITKGTRCPQAGGKVHSDFEERFIRAEVIPWEELVKTQSWGKARENGWIKIVGKDCVVQDGDVIEFKI